MSIKSNFRARFDRTKERGRYWSSLLSVPISPIGITSIIVMSKPSLPHHLIMSSNSSSLTPFRATALILIFKPTFLASSSPFKTWSNLPHLVISKNFCSFKVSSEILSLLTPASYNWPAIFDN